MAKKTEEKIVTIEREYIIPLREKCRVVPRYKKTPKAVKTIKEFLVKHMKIYDRDTRKIKIDGYLNDYLWFRGIRRPPHKIKVKVIKEITDGKELVRVELVDYPNKLKFKKIRAEKLEKKAEENTSKKKKEKKEEPKETEETKEEKAEDKREESEKKASVVEAGREFEKAAAKQSKHSSIEAGRIKQMTKQKHQMRKALAK
ncbi:MAG: 50S ribosomal protein L31e [Candidatus Pacearchaeota archaeon]